MTLRIGMPLRIKKHKLLQFEEMLKIVMLERSRVVGIAYKNWADLISETLIELKETDSAPANTEKVLKKMATMYSPRFADSIANLLGKVLFPFVFTKVILDEKEISLLHNVVEKKHNSSLVFIPTHRSYFDYLILFHLLYRHHVTVPLVIAGDNLNFFPLGNVLKRMGAFFIKRRLKDDPDYTLIFKTYLSKIVKSGYDLEFFVEGGRTRSGRVRMPRIGLLKMLGEISRKTRRKIYVIPVSIFYEKLTEIEEYESENRQGKLPEKKGFFKRMLRLFQKSGPVYVRFGRIRRLPFTVTQTFADKIAHTLDRNTTISFSAIFTTILLTMKKLKGEELIHYFSILLNELRKLPEVSFAPSLEYAEINVPILTSKLVAAGYVLELQSETPIYIPNKKHEHELHFYKNSISFAIAPFYVSLITDPNIKKTAKFILKHFVKGYNGNETKLENRELIPIIKRFFDRDLTLLSIILSEEGNEEPERIKKVLLKKNIPFTVDDVYEIYYLLIKLSPSELRERCENLRNYMEKNYETALQ